MAFDNRKTLLENTFGVEDQVAIVTGASSGLGQHFARTLHRAGAHVLAVARRADRLNELAAELGDRCTVVAADVADPMSPDAVVGEALTSLGRLDILVNAAGVRQDEQVLAVDETADSFSWVQQVNVLGLFAFCQRAGAHMLEAGSGTVVNIGSILGEVGPPGDVGYAASKGAVASLTRALAVQWARHGVRVNCLAPGFFPSEMSDTLIGSEKGAKWVTRRCPMRRTGTLSELDGALLFLCSSASSYYTGQVLAVDGGWTAA